MARVGLVLGAGGIAGGAWHAGVLAALQEVAGFDGRDAAVLVGTSAGSVTAAGLRAGLSPADLWAIAAADELPDEVRARLGDAGGGPLRFERVARIRPKRPANPALLRSLASRDPRPFVALAGLLPFGQVDATTIGRRVEAVAGGSAWPEEPLWVVAVRLADGKRVTFGRDVVPPEGLGAAVAASCAIPGWFAPVRVDGRRHVDGGVHSTTNADLVVDQELDAVVVSAPMAGTWRALRPHPTALSRASARVALQREVAALRRAGVPVVVLEPGPEDTPLMDGRAMDPASRVPVAHRAKASALAALARPEAAEVLDRLRD